MKFYLHSLVGVIIGAWLQAAPSAALREAVQARVTAEHVSLKELYVHLHQHPELSWFEFETGKRFAAELRQAGCEVTTGVGTNGVVGVLRQGIGPTVLVRCDLDGLPVKEDTGLPYASTARAPDGAGGETGLMHACGHDVHMTVVIGVARILARLRDQWAGTVVFIGQPAEERGTGARAMLADGLYSRFGVPAQALSLHCSPTLPPGTVGVCPGYALANVDTLDISVRGVGGHGAFPHVTRDPIVLAAQTILALQTIRSREIDPREAVVVTIGSVHGGSKHNIIPNDVALQLTVRSYTDAVRNRTLESIRRIVRGQAISAGVPEDRLPEVRVRDGFTPALYNDPALTRRLQSTWENWLGTNRVEIVEPVMGGEDFSEFGRTPEKVPLCDVWIGVQAKEILLAAKSTGKTPPGLHSAQFAPVADPAIDTGVTALTAAVLELLGRK